MIYYRSGAIGRAIRERISDVKQSVRSGKKAETRSFGDVLKSYLGNSDTEIKTVSSVASSSSGTKSVDGSTLLYAMLNSDSDTTASAVLDSLGYSSTYSSAVSGTLRAAAADLRSSADALRLAVKDGSTEGAADAFARFTADYNLLVARLGLSSGTSGYLYRNALGVYANESGLAGTGLSLTANGSLAATGEAVDEEKLSAFLTGVTTVAQNISTYSDTTLSGSLAGLASSYGSIFDQSI
ncbi:MAG: hypothetical protein NC084_10600 [Bacteroides sp.]|nr:hypothetical protein [Eubacterium sp.]MCM1419285.1 hypothetical protein [Roseburia sp.]MCM1463147.1 hypothetical protein [Bacteroides sp.]